MEIAVIVPFHNQLSKLALCINSIKNQSIVDSVFVVVVDDGSDSPLLPSTDYHLARLNVNSGVQIARNTGFAYAKYGLPKYTLFCDADVVWKPHAFETFVRTLEQNPECSYAYGDYDRHGLFNGTFYAGTFHEDRMKTMNFVTTMSMIRTLDLPDPPFVEDERRLQDWSLWLRLLNAGHKGAYTGKIMFETTFLADSVSARGSQDYIHWHHFMLKRYVHKR